ncbi:MAG: hypothetical protein H0T43_05990 [Solirubrobacterales bacterium]|nr:hypothetical protein [Solirubrobacterales bacterium]
MAKRAKRKRQPRAAGSGGFQAPTPPPPKRAERRGAEHRDAAAEPKLAGRGGRPDRFDVRDGVRRPKPVWAPFPLTEIGLVAGIVIFAIGLLSGEGDRGPVLIGVGALVLSVVVAEMCVREHFAGFRSHSLLLGLLPVALAHSLLVFVVTGSWAGPVALAVDLAAFAALAWLLHARYRAAHARARAAR